jgi:hypothetical protein
VAIDWVAWHQGYQDPDSPLSARLAVVQAHLRDLITAAGAGPIQLVSICAGQGRDVIGALAGHPRRSEVRATLIEADPRLAQAARAGLAEIGLAGVVLSADAGCTDSYDGLPAAGIIVACGIFGNISEADIQTTIAGLRSLASPGAAVVWTRHRREPDRTGAIRGWFRQYGYRELAFTAPEQYHFTVGVARLEVPPTPRQSGQRLFTFPEG